MGRIVLILSYFTLLCGVGAAGIEVNEYYNGTGSTPAGTKMVRDEFIEFAITQSMTSAELAALTFGDANGQTNALQGVFQFYKPTLDALLAGAGLSTFLPGTLIAVKGTNLGEEDLDYNPLAKNTADDDAWSFELVAGKGAVDHAEKLINGNINIANAADVVWISTNSPPKNNTDTSGFISAIGHDTNPGYIADQVISEFGADHIFKGNVGTKESLYNAEGATVVLATGASTMSQPNSAKNAFWITELRQSAFVTVPEPSRALLLMVGTWLCLFRRRREVCHES